MDDAVDPAQGHAPTHEFIPGQGYANEQIGDQDAPTNQDSRLEADGDDDDYDDIFAEDEIDTEDYASYNPSDFTKNYNRQRRIQEVSADHNAPKSSFPKTNPQKPTANTLASVDDQ
ncbi:MAG: hypothetical protein Q9183_006382, partial [Haloplaca sp. 2 TL-2023]